MKVTELELQGVKLIEPPVYQDARGFFTESYQQSAWSDAGIVEAFIQDNHSLSIEMGVIRGLHFQVGESAQSKLVRVLSGSIYDVVVDIRPESPTFTKWSAVTLRAEDHQQLLVPKGFAHGFCTLEPNTQVFYKVDQLYNREKERGIYWADPEIGIYWPIDSPILSEKDRQLPLLDSVKQEIGKKEGIV
ncbi:dTDP-4-dehydrorhamnose 3,5-epimerase [Alkalicoccobacillus plakortidis]|uniref:dTDP-4-dehydrorhamnose 3,5-epimerase n=1 Tax=Alkalicoccobacillus plakortidis TaxID=444060 RepID=A0ABT0XIW8_9BACI|nr:dTDP-4-dehydrorhamnose 3,5-epimerase [Alkalicoccobacillus plakortidis]MCM2675844.1 dTDP-4-dehydrorhamnose 3,5-epimerase [Alkalicoccobacillus plakortidis]